MKLGTDKQLPKEIEDAWFCSKNILGIECHLNDSVEVINGEYKGKLGSVITLLTTIPSPKYLIEFTNGDEAQILQNDLKLIEC